MTVRRYQLTVNNNEYEIDIEEISATEFQVLIDGQTLDVILASQADAADASRRSPPGRVSGPRAASEPLRLSRCI